MSWGLVTDSLRGDPGPRRNWGEGMQAEASRRGITSRTALVIGAPDLAGSRLFHRAPAVRFPWRRFERGVEVRRHGSEGLHHPRPLPLPSLPDRNREWVSSHGQQCRRSTVFHPKNFTQEDRTQSHIRVNLQGCQSPSFKAPSTQGLVHVISWSCTRTQPEPAESASSIATSTKNPVHRCPSRTAFQPGPAGAAGLRIHQG